jgi:hypothetical protein
MNTKQTTLAGKPITLAYCYATEISYKLLSDEDITVLMQETSDALNADQPRMPDVRKTIFLILAAASAYYESKGEQLPIDDKALMYDTTPSELGTALGVILSLRTQFYAVPSDEPDDQPATDGSPVGTRKRRKNA